MVEPRLLVARPLRLPQVGRVTAASLAVARPAGLLDGVATCTGHQVGSGVGGHTRAPPEVGRHIATGVSEVELRRTLDTYSLDLTATDIAHLHQWFLPSAARILRWDVEATWARRLAEPYYPGMEMDWRRTTILAVEPKWVRAWPPYSGPST